MPAIGDTTNEPLLDKLVRLIGDRGAINARVTFKNDTIEEGTVKRHGDLWRIEAPMSLHVFGLSEVRDIEEITATP